MEAVREEIGARPARVQSSQFVRMLAVSLAVSRADCWVAFWRSMDVLRYKRLQKAQDNVTGFGTAALVGGCHMS